MSKIKLLTSILCLSFYSLVQAQINIQWQESFDNSNGIDESVGIVVDNSGNSYVTGTSFNGSNFDIVTIKYDIDGNQLWLSTYNGAFDNIDQAKSIAMDGNGNIYVFGNTLTAATDQDLILIKYNPNNGNEEWATVFNGTGGYDLPGDIAIDGNNNIFATGTTDHTGNFRIITIKFNDAGAIVWSDEYNNGGNNGIHFGIDVTIDNSNSVYVLGEVEDNGSQGQNYTVIKYLSSSTGNRDWIQEYDADGNNDSPTSITNDGTHIYMTGGSYISDLSHKQDYYTVKALTSTGAEVWDVLYNGSGSDTDIANAITVDGSGDIYITGSSIGEFTAQDFVTIGYNSDGTEKWIYNYNAPGAVFDVGNELIIGTSGAIYASGTSYTSGVFNDYATLKFTPTGELEWDIKFNGPANGADNAIDMHVDAGENIFITGKSKAAATNFDYRTIKYCQLTTIASNDTSVCIGESVTLGATGGTNFMWNVVSGDPSMSCTSCQTPNVTPNQTTTYAVSSVSGSGCVDYDTVVVTINPLPGPTITPDGPTAFCIGDSVRLTTETSDAYLWNVATNNTDSFIVVHSTGTYSVTVEDSMGCENTTDIDVTVYSLPNIDGGIDHDICIGDSTQLDATGGDTYLWVFDPSIGDHTDPMTWVYPTDTTTYTVVGTDVNGCKDTGYVTITLNPLPEPFDLIVQDDTLIISPQSNNNEWFHNTIPQPQFTTNEVDWCAFDETPGQFWVLYTDNNNCQIYSDTVTFTLDDTSHCFDPITDGVFDLTSELSTTIYPNPAKDLITIYFNNTLPKNLKIFDINGRNVISLNQLNLQQEINIESLQTGPYLILFELENNRFARQRFIKK